MMEVDAFLIGLHALHILWKAGGGLTVWIVGTGEAQQREDLVLVGVVLRQAFLQDRAEFLPEYRVLLGLVLHQLGQHVEHALGEATADGIDFRILLQQLTRHVQRQVARVDDAFYEAQVLWQELLGVVHDEDAAHIKFADLVSGIALPQPSKRRTTRDVEQARVFALAFDLVVAPGERICVVVTDVLIELLVFLVLDFGTGQCPQGLGFVD